MILLDTCTLLWLVLDQSKLSNKAKVVIAKNAGNLFVSAITGFEIGINVKKELLILPAPAEEWFESATQLHGIEVAPITDKVAIRSTLLPDNHRDTADRFIIATALINKFQIVTADKHISNYADVSVIW